MGFVVWANRVVGASNAGEREKMRGAYRKQKERMGYIEERGEEKGSFKKCCAAIKEKEQEPDLK